MSYVEPEHPDDDRDFEAEHAEEAWRGEHGEVLEAAATAPDWTKGCEVCGAAPIVPLTGLCGPCTFGEAETAGGNW